MLPDSSSSQATMRRRLALCPHRSTLDREGKEMARGGHSQSQGPSVSYREHTTSLADFGGMGDGTASNTAAYWLAVEPLPQFSGARGMLYVPVRKWLMA